MVDGIGVFREAHTLAAMHLERTTSLGGQGTSETKKSCRHSRCTLSFCTSKFECKAENASGRLRDIAGSTTDLVGKHISLYGHGFDSEIAESVVE